MTGWNELVDKCGRKVQNLWPPWKTFCRRQCALQLAFETSVPRSQSSSYTSDREILGLAVLTSKKDNCDTTIWGRTSFVSDLMGRSSGLVKSRVSVYSWPGRSFVDVRVPYSTQIAGCNQYCSSLSARVLDAVLAFLWFGRPLQMCAGLLTFDIWNSKSLTICCLLCCVYKILTEFKVAAAIC